MRTLMPDPVLRKLACESAEFYRNPPKNFSTHPLVDQVGIYFAARDDHARDLLSCLEDGREEHAPRKVDPAQLYERASLLAPGLTCVLYQADEGVFDVDAVLQSFLKGASREGAELRTTCEARCLMIRDGKVEGLDTSTGLLRASRVLIEAGGWAAEMAAAAGYPAPLIPCRRHLLITEPLPQVNRRWPVVWILGEDFYFRPESGGLLMCGRDTVPVLPENGAVTDPVAIERITVKAARWLPSLARA